MKKKSTILFLMSMLSICYLAKSQKSTSGYILFGKNKTEGNVVCSQQGICKLQALFYPDFIPVTFTAIPVKGSSPDSTTSYYSISMTINLKIVDDLQPEQGAYFRDTNNPYVISDNFSLPAWLITDLGFDRSLNRFISLKAPISMDIPKPDQDDNITLILAPSMAIKTAAEISK